MAPRLRRVHSVNDELQLVMSLVTNRRQRQRQGRFVVEGVRAINEAVAHEWPLDSFWFPAGRRLSDWARSLLDAGVARSHYELDAALMARLSAKQEASELIAVAEIPPDDLDRIPVRDDTLIVAFDRPVSPGNLGSVIRSAQALGADGLVVTGHAVDVYDPQTVRAALGALFALPVVRAGAMTDVAAWFTRIREEVGGLQIVGTSARATTGIDAVDFTRPCVIALGNETRGLSVGWRELCDELAVIGMSGPASSLNVAAAAAIVLYECRRQRARAVSNRAGDRA